MCAIGMANLFVINLKCSRAVEGEKILKLPRPTLFQHIAPLVWARKPVVRFAPLVRLTPLSPT